MSSRTSEETTSGEAAEDLAEVGWHVEHARARLAALRPSAAGPAAALRAELEGSLLALDAARSERPEQLNAARSERPDQPSAPPLVRHQGGLRQLYRSIAFLETAAEWHSSPGSLNHPVHELTPLSYVPGYNDYQRGYLPWLRRHEQHFPRASQATLTGGALLFSSGMGAIQTTLQFVMSRAKRLLLGRRTYYETQSLLALSGVRERLRPLDEAEPRREALVESIREVDAIFVDTVSLDRDAVLLDLPRLYDAIEAAGRTDFDLVLDNTVLGPQLQIPAPPKGCRLYLVESLLKNYQAGLDLAAAGMLTVVAPPDRAASLDGPLLHDLEVLRSTNGTNLTANSARLLPLVPRERIVARMQRQARNAARLADGLRERCDVRPIERSGLLFCRHPNAAALLSFFELLALARHIRLLRGTSFGFNDTRVALVPGHDDQLRFACGMEHENAMHALVRLVCQATEAVDDPALRAECTHLSRFFPDYPQRVAPTPEELAALRAHAQRFERLVSGGPVTTLKRLAMAGTPGRLLLRRACRACRARCERPLAGPSLPRHAALAALFAFATEARAQQAETFAPPATRPTLGAARVARPLQIDGRLDERDWGKAPATSPFVQAEPAQGQPATEATEARVLFDADYLYVGVRAFDRGGTKGLRAPDLRRDFETSLHDSITLVFDTLGDGRNATSFAVNPYGAQGDQQALDDTLFETAWDGVWRVATSRDARGWTAEFAIPWKTLRYAPGSPTFGFQVARALRRRNEFSSWSPYPRAFSPFRMSYAGVLTGLVPPAPPLNLLVRPYAAVRLSGASDRATELRPTAGGEARWAPTPNATIDLTVNTDFGEAEVDRQVINLRRNSVFFPERRQFFLESASIFQVGSDEEFLEPFFSRRIGLSDDGRRLPIDAGARAVWRSREANAGALVVRTRPSGAAPGAEFAVARYSHNVGEQSRVGAFLAARRDDPRGGVGALTNVVPGVDGLYRQGQVTLQGMASASSTEGGAPAPAGFVGAQFGSNQFIATFSETYINERYDARTGFVARNDVIRTRQDLFHDWRPSFLPGGLRALRAYGNGEVYHRASDGSPQEANAYVEPLWFHLDTSDDAWFGAEGSWQRLDEPFSPLRGVVIPPGEYSYGSVGAVVRSDASRQVGFEVRGFTGTFYGANWQRAHGQVQLAPVPHLFALVSYDLNRFSGLPPPTLSPRLTHLVQSELRVAATPKLQLAGIGQYNSDAGVLSGNARLAWEFEPLSFVYLVYTDARRRYPGEDEPRREQQILLKINYSYLL